ncbi:MAG: BatA domain-containing protein, partial [Methanosarcinales archaeon]
MVFENLYGLLALLSIIPLIIAYLLKPKPRDVYIPSLMFIMSIEGEMAKYKSSLKKFVKEPLFLIQLLVLIFLSFAIASPFINLMEYVHSDNTVIIIDGSASMQSTDVKPSRFSVSIDKAKDFISKKTSIILAENVPVEVLREGSSKDAESILDSLTPKATTTNIGDAILLGKEILGGKGRIVVLSDFANNEGTDPIIIKKMVASSGIFIDFIPIGGKGDNIGITSINIGNEKYGFTIRNYMPTTKTIKIIVTTNGEKTTGAKATMNIEKEITLKPQDSDFFALQNIGKGITEITVSVDDDLEVDNKVFINVPEVKTRDILIISENKTSPLKVAVSAIPNTKVKVLRTDPPEFNQDMVILGNIKKDTLVTPDFSNFKNYVESGGNLVIMASEDLNLISPPLLPVELGEISTSGGTVKTEIINEFTKDIDFGTVTKYFKAKEKNGSVVVARAADNSPLIAYWSIGTGKVVYFGINYQWSDFMYKPSYPIFWLQLTDWMTGVSNIREFNVKTGTISSYYGSDASLKTPTTTINANGNILLDEVGVYELQNKKIAVNLVNEKESDISAVPQNSSDYKFEKVKVKVKKDFWQYLLLIAMGLVGYELFYLKSRGEL